MNKAIVTTINYAGLNFEGLMLPDGSYAVGLAQLNPLLAVPQKNAARDLKSLLGKEFQYLKVASELNPRKVSILTLPQLSTVVKGLAKQGNKQAWKLLDACFLEKMERIFDSAFGNEVGEREREARFKLRMRSKVTRRSYTDILKERLIKQYGEDGYKKLATNGYFRDVTVLVNDHLFNQPHFKCNRDNMDDYQLREIEHFEAQLDRRARRKLDHTAEQLLNWMLENF